MTGLNEKQLLRERKKLAKIVMDGEVKLDEIRLQIRIIDETLSKSK